MSVQQTLMGRFTSLESDTPPDDLEIESPEEGVDDTGAQLDGENIVEGDLVEAAEDSAEIDDADNEAEELEDTSDSLESFLLAAQLGKRSGGWSEGEALAYGLGIDATLKRLGCSSSDVMPSLESFKGGERERLESTASVENKIKDAIMAVWEAIKRAVNKVVAFVRKWYVKIFDGASRLKKRALAIRKKAENTQGTAKEKKIRTSVLAQLHKSKSMPSAKDLVKTIQDLTDSTKKLTSGRLDAGYEQAVDELVKTITSTAETDGKLSDADALGAIVKIRSSSVFTIELGFNTNKAGKDEAARVAPVVGHQNAIADYMVTGELPGGKKLGYFVLGQTKGDNQGQLGRNIASSMRLGAKVTLTDYSSKKVDVDTSKDVTILDLQEVVSIADAVMDFCQAVVDYKLGFDKYEKKNSAALGKVDALLRKANNKEDDKDGRERGEFIRGLAQGLGALMRNRGTSITNVINYGMTVSRSALVFGVQSMAQYKD